jgi:hypothetical protein
MPVEVRQERVLVSPHFSVSFQRAQWMRTPDTHMPYNLGALPVHRVTDYSEHLPEAWSTTAGVFVPVLPEEAIWLGFGASSGHPNAVQIELGDVDAVTGGPFSHSLGGRPQNYFVCPPQLHWDGVWGARSIRPFSAETLSLNTGTFKTLQIIVYEPFPGQPFQTSSAPITGLQPLHALSPSSPQPETNAAIPDLYGLNTWDQKSAVALSVHFLEPTVYEKVTGQAPPPPRQSKDVFTGYRLP